ncbi:hypothetical protein ACWEO4_43580 [Streptomyces sp. NPDC004393]|uniref:hypothetical protein n=1 Tax=Streptomyces sp. NPDC004533 TaxID=3154278 RepID=UPI0033B306A8
MVQHLERKHREALERGDAAAAEQYKLHGQGFFFETERYQPKRIAPAAEAERLPAAEDEKKRAVEDAEHWAVLKKKLGSTPTKRTVRRMLQLLQEIATASCYERKAENFFAIAGVAVAIVAAPTGGEREQSIT